MDALNDGTAVTYDDRLCLDGHVNIHPSESDPGTVIAQNDIGTNVYTLTPVADPALTRTLTIAKRQKCTSLVTLALTGTQAGATHNSQLHRNSVAQGGPIVIDLKPVNGTIGMAVTSVSEGFE